MKNKILYITLLGCILYLTSCTSAHHKQDRVLMVTIEPLRYFTEQVAGEDWKVVTMVPKGSSPETYDPTPAQLVSLSKATAYFSVGHLGFEQQWLSRLQENAPQVKFFDTSRGIELLKGHHDHEGHADDTDPHVWTTPRNALLMVRNICEALCQLDEGQAEAYRSRLALVEKKIQHTDSIIRQVCQQGVQSHFIIYHPSLSYFAQDYGLVQIAIEKDGKEPSPVYLQQLIKECQAHQVRTVFVQSEFNTQNAQVIAREIGAQVVSIQPLNYEWHDEMLQLINVLKK